MQLIIPGDLGAHEEEKEEKTEPLSSGKGLKVAGYIHNIEDMYRRRVPEKMRNDATSSETSFGSRATVGLPV